jgi:hypothetical protein
MNLGLSPATDHALTLEGGRYSVHRDPEVDDRIEADLKVITNAVKAAYPDLRSTVLVGSFGRGEGQVSLVGAGSGRSIRPLNDYDLVLITESSRADASLNELRSSLARQIGIDWVDLVIYPQSKLARLRPTLFNYDLKYGSRVIDGDADVLAEMPSWSPEDIPLDEAERLLFTRLWCLLGPYRLGMEDRPQSPAASRFLRRQIAKALIGVQDAQLMLIGAYDPSYRRRARRFRREFAELADIFPLLEAALGEKLSPGEEDLGALSSGHAYACTRLMMLEAFRLLGTALYRRRLENAFDYERAYFRCGPRRLDRARGRLRGHAYHRRTQLVNAAQLHLVEAQAEALAHHREERSVSSLHCQRARELLQHFDRGAVLPEDWDGLREAAARMRMAV